MPPGRLEFLKKLSDLSQKGLKECTKCKEVKPLSEFYENAKSRGGRYSKCALCCSKYSLEWHHSNPERAKAKMAAWREENSEHEASYRREYYNSNSERLRRQRREYHKANPERTRISVRKWRRSNIERARKREREYYHANKHKASRKADQALRSILHNFLRWTKSGKDSRTHEALGYSSAQLREHMERQFVKGMSWDNYGDWHIDHIVPMSHYISIGQIDPSIVNCLSNLRPVWAKENLSKSDKRTHLI
jgi:hypothetical protein